MGESGGWKLGRTLQGTAMPHIGLSRTILVRNGSGLPGNKANTRFWRLARMLRKRIHQTGYKAVPDGPPQESLRKNSL